MGYDYVDWRDPRPAVKATVDFVRQSVRAVATHYLMGGTGRRPPRLGKNSS